MDKFVLSSKNWSCKGCQKENTLCSGAHPAGGWTGTRRSPSDRSQSLSKAQRTQSVQSKCSNEKTNKLFVGVSKASSAAAGSNKKAKQSDDKELSNVKYVEAVLQCGHSVHTFRLQGASLKTLVAIPTTAISAVKKPKKKAKHIREAYNQKMFSNMKEGQETSSNIGSRTSIQVLKAPPYGVVNVVRTPCTNASFSTTRQTVQWR